MPFAAYPIPIEQKSSRAVEQQNSRAAECSRRSESLRKKH